MAFICLIFIVFQGNVTFSCSEPQIVPITFVNSSSSYLLLPGTPQIDGLSVGFQFRTWSKDGLLLSTELSEGSGTLLLSLEGGTLRLLIQKMMERAAEILAGTVCSQPLGQVLVQPSQRIFEIQTQTYKMQLPGMGDDPVFINVFSV